MPSSGDAWSTLSTGLAAVPDISAALRRQRIIEEVVAPAGRRVLDGAHLVHELGQRKGVLRLQLELHVGVLDYLDQEVAVLLGAGDAQVDVGGLLRIGGGKGGGFLQRFLERLVRLGVFLAEFLGRKQHGG
ncbi:hypothetical protein G6F50_016580 [Rhizopus delemar]|uniref:Uncharacterized protein n=1 Tax=Rhizopus delemar TaxID=936053 RepID=A0A9P7C100_9FUNG|nr:hypothetical protein G6F50_016580 [Rhizopus delemar]